MGNHFDRGSPENEFVSEAERFVTYGRSENPITKIPTIQKSKDSKPAKYSTVNVHGRNQALCGFMLPWENALSRAFR